MISIDQYEKHAPALDYIGQYASTANPASGSAFDPNANIHRKNVTTLEGEVVKADMIGINRLAMHRKIIDLFDQETADEYIRQLEAHEVYRHDETALIGKPYCVSVTLYPFLLDGMKGIGGASGAPKNLQGFAGGFVNLVFAIASQFAGAVSTPEFLPYLDYYFRKEYGDDYPRRCEQWARLPDIGESVPERPIHTREVVDLSLRRRTLDKIVTDVFEQIVYSLNQPAAARNYQSVFWNIAYFDRPYFEGLFENFRFPDGTPMSWDTVNWLQKRFMNWFNMERTRSQLTFPVETVNLLDDGSDYVDQEWKEFTADMWAKGHSFFVYRSDSVDSLSSCCRLKSELQDNVFSYTLGAGGIATGSKCVMTMNLNRLIQNLSRVHGLVGPEDIEEAVRAETEKLHKYLKAFNAIMEEIYDAGLLPVYNAGFISMDKQFLTIGINGFIEGAEFLGIPIDPMDETYQMYAQSVMRPIYEANRAARTKKHMFNCEFVPAEGLGVKNAAWDRADGFEVPRDVYNSYFYAVEDQSCDVLSKFLLHGKAFTEYLDGGSALHVNLDEHLTAVQYKQLLDVALKTGCSYFTFNVPNTICNACEHISKHRLQHCEACGSDNLDYATRIIGYLTRISSFSAARQEEAQHRFYHSSKREGSSCGTEGI